jgi:hypothetical protein
MLIDFWPALSALCVRRALDRGFPRLADVELIVLAPPIDPEAMTPN